MVWAEGGGFRQRLILGHYVNYHVYADYPPADQVIIAGVFHKETDQVAESDLFSPQHLVDDLVARRISARTLPDADAIRDVVLDEARGEDVVLLMSNGGFGGLRQKLVETLGSGSTS